MEFWYSLAALLVPVVAVVASAHAVVTKRDSRSALTWVALLWLVPLLGAILYLLFGINRIRRRASALYREPLSRRDPRFVCGAEELATRFGGGQPHMSALARSMDRLTIRPLVRGNRVESLIDGDEAYPAMLRAIAEARDSVSLSTYIFGNDRVGRAFADALEAAVQRGVAVRVLIDNAGERYTWPSMVGHLRRRGVPVARFFPRLPARLVGMNLRNHRKLLVVDGLVGFTGGMNIRRHHMNDAGRRATRDIHFRLRGPVVAQLQEVFHEDWQFSAGERLDGDAWFPQQDPQGAVVARGVRAGPDENVYKHHMALHAGIASARESIRVMTPYFLPDATLITALNLASIRGVEVDIILPEHSNLPFVHWAMMAQIGQILEYDCRIWLTPGPFDHSKLMVVDGAWTFLGSTNWDPRSLRLNFEFNVECYDRDLARDLTARMDARLATARAVTRRVVDGRALPIRLRDGIARLLMPFL